MGWWNKMARDKLYTEYGYRGAQELQAAREEINKLKQQVQDLENRCNELQAKASLPRS